MPVASVLKKPAAKAPAKPTAAKNPHIAAPKPAAPLARLSSTPTAAPVAKAPVVRSHLTSLINVPLGTAVAGTIVRVKEGTGAWVKVGMSPVPLAFVPITHVSANFCKEIESVLKVR